MLTRLKVSGFKNLVDVDVRLGPFTCVVGPNGVGKSNLFDAIRFLSGLAQGTLTEAAAAVRDQDSRAPDVRNLFQRAGDRYVERMSFEAEMLVPRKAVDDLGQEATASITFLRYSLTLRYRETGNSLIPGALEIVEEELVHISQRDALRHLLFPHSVKHWRESVLQGPPDQCAVYFDPGRRRRQDYLPAPGRRRGRPPGATGGQPAAHRSFGCQRRRKSHGVGGAP